MDGTRARRTREPVRQAWYARRRRFARFLGFVQDAPAPQDRDDSRDRGRYARASSAAVFEAARITNPRESTPAPPPPLAEPPGCRGPAAFHVPGDASRRRSRLSEEDRPMAARLVSLDGDPPI